MALTSARSVLPLALAACAATGILFAPSAAAAGSASPSPVPSAGSVTGGTTQADAEASPRADRTAAPATVAPTRVGAGQVRTVPRGAAQAGEGDTGPSTTMMVGGAGLAAAGAAAVGFAILRRRAGEQG